MTLTPVADYSNQVVKWALMDSAYLRSVWKLYDEEEGEEKAHACLEEVYSKKGFTVRNLHRDDRRHEAGTDLLCTRRDTSIAFAVKRKPKQGDISQLKKIAASDPATIKFYVHLDSPTRPFEHAMGACANVHYLDWSKLHSLLIQNGSVNYVLVYFAAHKLFDNLSDIYNSIYDKRATKRYNHSPDREEVELMWSIKDDAVKLKSCFEYLQATWRPVLLTRAEYNKKEWAGYIARLHEDLDVINNIAGESLCHSFLTMSSEFPHLAASYWDLVSCRTVWKDFTATAIELGRRSVKDLREFIRHEWVVPTLEPTKRLAQYGPIRSVYSALWAVVESTYRIAYDIEEGVDWLHHELI